ncbi:hypothetical protein [Mycobacterium kansasii]|uniref:hypothetical protein n=1 Tax=Mycobacterium kansasii TaxID=1768 RepID=UPI001403AC79|nr:hypothetical protein [Mycobacterium kansasii]
MSEEKPLRVWRQRVQPGHTTISVREVTALARAVLDSAPAPLPWKLRQTLSEVVYRCAVVPEAYENPEWVALRDQVLAPGADLLLDFLGVVIPQVAVLADEAPSPVVDQALAELSDLPEQVLAIAQRGSVPHVVQMEFIKTVREILERVRAVIESSE